MVKTFTFLCALGLLIAAPLAQAASGKVGVVDVQQILAKSPAAQAAKAQLKAYGEKQQAILKKRSDAVKKEHDDIQKNAAIQTKAAQKKAMQKFQSDYQNFQQEVQTKQQAFGKKRAQILQPLQAKLYDVIQNYATHHGYELVLDKSAAIYSTDSVDLTDAVLKAFNAAEAKK
ncbi:MAG: OmpH family outer membrane protein [Gammaproteobacteria bacterium]